MKRKLLSTFLAFVMALSLLPTAALATEEPQTREVSSAEELVSAIGVAADGDTIKLLNDITGLTARIDTNFTGTIDLNKHKMSSSATCANGSVFNVKSGSITIKNGTLVGIEGDAHQAAPYAQECDVITVRSGATATLQDLNISVNSGNGCCAYAFDGGKIYIESGTYTNETTTSESSSNGKVVAMLVNQADNKEQAIFISGGIFKGRNPGLGDNSGIPATFLADGYTVSGTDRNWTVSPKVYVASVGNDQYETLDAAIAAAETGDTIELLKDITSNSTFKIQNSELVLDLNGKTLKVTVGSGYGAIEVDGINAKLTIKDSGDGGKLVSADNNYGVNAMNGGTVVMESGTIESGYAALTGNNTTGNMNFTVNGGTLTAKYGPAIYMPGQVGLTVTGGTLNGGISLRMGQVNISGGTINAITSSIDSPAKYYNYSGNAWFPDALYVFGGTYKSEDATYGNSLNLNITGGTFNCDNDQGSAVAIYDLGKEAQTMNVNISGSAALATASTMRSAYQVLKLTDIEGYDTAKSSDYNNNEYVGKVNTSITGGIFSSDPTAYCAEGKTGVANTDAKTKADYPFTVGTVATNVEVAPATTEAKAETTGKADNVASAMNAAATSVGKTTVSGLDAAAGSEATKIEENKVEEAKEELNNAGVTVGTGETVTVYVQPYLDIKVTDAKVADGGSTPTTITLDIKPMVKEIASTATSASDIVTKADATDGSGKTQNAVQVGKAKELTVTTPVTLTIPLPSGFVSSTTDNVFVKHSKENGASYIYTATVTNSGETYYATFTNPNGFSTFDFTTENPAVAQIGTQNYPTLQAAVDAVKNEETIQLLKSDGTATVNRTVKFTVTPSTYTYTINLGSYCTDKDEGADVYDVVYDRPSSGSSKYSISLPETMTHGSAKLSKASASKGDKVTLTVTPDKGYTLEILNATDAKGNEVELTAVELGKEYTFKMPASAVTLEVTFMEDNTMLNYFVDVNAGDYFYDSVLWAAENGITKGVDDLHFDPNGLCTRAQIVTFLWRASGSPEAKAESSFSDVAAGSYYAEAVAWAVANGITNGTGNGAFSPDATCTRAQAVTFLARALNAKAESRAAFGDVPETAYYADAVAWAAESGVTTGVGAGRFAPDDDCTRAQIVTFLWRAMVK